MPIKLFYFYALEDTVLCQEMERRLYPLQKQGMIDVWHPGKVAPGQTGEEEVKKHLQEADLILVPVSPDLLYSQDVLLQMVLERHAKNQVRVVPILLRPTHIEGSRLATLRALPADGPISASVDRDKAWLDVIRGIVLVINTAELQRSRTKKAVLEAEVLLRRKQQTIKSFYEATRSIWTKILMPNERMLNGIDQSAYESAIDILKRSKTSDSFSPEEFLILMSKEERNEFIELCTFVEEFFDSKEINTAIMTIGLNCWHASEDDERREREAQLHAAKESLEVKAEEFWRKVFRELNISLYRIHPVEKWIENICDLYENVNEQKEKISEVPTLDQLIDYLPSECLLLLQKIVDAAKEGTLSEQAIIRILGEMGLPYSQSCRIGA